jgi:glycosyltransferase involved in cell wall biosynthesis
MLLGGTIVCMKPKLLVIITKPNWGGAQKYVYDIATAKLVQENYEVLVAVGAKGELTDRLKASSIEVRVLKQLANSINFFKLFRSVLELLLVITKNKPDIVHTNSSFAGIAVSTACFLLGKKSVFTVHGWPFNEKRTTQQKFLLRSAMFFVMLLHTKVICVSRTAFSQFPGFLKTRRKAKVVHNGISKTAQRSFSEVTPGYKKSGTNFVTIAELHTSKNHLLVLDAFDVLPKEVISKHNVTYHIIGEGSERKAIEKRIALSPYKDRIHLYGAIPNASQYLASFDIFVLGSITEGLGYVLLEAGLASIPVIATRVGGVPEVIKDDVTGMLVRSKSIPEMSLAMKDLIEHKPMRLKLAVALKLRVEKEFSKDTMIAETIKVYEKLYYKK